MLQIGLQEGETMLCKNNNLITIIEENNELKKNAVRW